MYSHLFSQMILLIVLVIPQLVSAADNPDVVSGTCEAELAFGKAPELQSNAARRELLESFDKFSKADHSFLIVEIIEILVKAETDNEKIEIPDLEGNYLKSLMDNITTLRMQDNPQIYDQLSMLAVLANTAFGKNLERENRGNLKPGITGILNALATLEKPVPDRTLARLMKMILEPNHLVLNRLGANLWGIYFNIENDPSPPSIRLIRQLYIDQHNLAVPHTIELHNRLGNSRVFPESSLSEMIGSGPKPVAFLIDLRNLQEERIEKLRSYLPELSNLLDDQNAQVTLGLYTHTTRDAWTFLGDLRNHTGVSVHIIPGNERQMHRQLRIDYFYRQIDSFVKLFATHDENLISTAK